MYFFLGALRAMQNVEWIRMERQSNFAINMYRQLSIVITVQNCRYFLPKLCMVLIIGDHRYNKQIFRIVNIFLSLSQSGGKNYHFIEYMF